MATNTMMNDIASVMAMVEIFGDREFTKKEWDNAKVKGMATVEHLSERCWASGERVILVPKVRTERFAIEVEDVCASKTTFIINSNGEKVMRKTEFDKLPLSVKNLLETTNGGAFTVKDCGVTTVDAVRYFYKVDVEAFAKYINASKREIAKAIRETEKSLVKLEQKKKTLENFKTLL